MSPTPPIPDWQELAKAKQESTYAKIPEEWRLPKSLTAQYTETSTLSVIDVPRTCALLTLTELEITEQYDASTLVQMMSTGKLTSTAVVTAFCKRAAIAHQCTNCLTEIYFDAALARAAECDAYLSQEGKPKGPLHGLPISLKDSFNVTSVAATIGYISFLSHPPATSNSAVVDILLQAGAVLYCKSNLPQSMMTADSHNNIFGRTLNPHNLSLTAGGSTGGESALLAMRGSVLGVSTDVAGSNRIPALCCGVVSLKPTASRIPFAGGVPPGRFGSPSPIVPVVGPCARSIGDLGLFMKTVGDAGAWRVDEACVNVKWRSVKAYARPLRFGLLRGAQERPLHPPVARALHICASGLKGAGHGIVLLDDKVPSVYDAAVLSWKFFLLDPAKTPLQHIRASGEPFIPSLATCAFPELADWTPSLEELFDMNVQRAQICRQWRELMVKEELDAVILPGYQSVTPKHDTYGVPIYTVLQNLLNYPAGIVSCGVTDKEKDRAFVKGGVEYIPPCKLVLERRDRKGKLTICADEPDVVEGMPAHVQVMGRPMMDEELLQIMGVVEGVLKGR